MSRDLTFKSEPLIYSRCSRLHSGGGKMHSSTEWKSNSTRQLLSRDERRESDGKYRRNAAPPDARAVAAAFQCAVDRDTGLFLLAVFYTIYFVRSLLLPLVLALLLSYLLRPIVRGLAKLKIPPLIGGALLLISLFGAFGYSVSFLAAPAAGWIDKAPYSLQHLQERLTPFKKPIAQVAQASGAIEKLTTTETAPAKTPTVEVKQHPITDRLFANTSELLVSTSDHDHPPLFPARLSMRSSSRN